MYKFVTCKVNKLTVILLVIFSRFEHQWVVFKPGLTCDLRLNFQGNILRLDLQVES